MLINFSFGNFRSFRAVKSLRMEAVQIKELSDSIIERDGFRLLPTAVLYGANSSGKTNVIMALGLFRNIVDKNIKLNPGEDLVYDPFLLDDCSKDEPTTFEIQCLFEGAVYRYGFEYTKNTIISEWLYEKKIGPGAKEHYLFRRERQTFSVSATYFSEGKGKESSTTENRLFLSLVAQLNGRIAQKLIKHLRDYNAISGLKDDGYERLMIDMLKKHLRGCDEAIDFFRRLDLGFTNIEIEERDIPNDLKETLATLPIISNDKFNNAKVIETLTTHNVYDAEGKVINTVRFDADDKESNGTNKVITLSGPIFDTLLGGKVLFVDELDSKLHPMMTRAIVRLFMDKETNLG